MLHKIDKYSLLQMFLLWRNVWTWWQNQSPFQLCLVYISHVYTMFGLVADGKEPRTVHKGKKESLTTVFRCLSPFEMETHIPLEKSVWADFSCETFKNVYVQFLDGQTTQEKKFGAKFGFLWKLFSISPLKLGFQSIGPLGRCFL